MKLRKWLMLFVVTVLSVSGSLVRAQNSNSVIFLVQETGLIRILSVDENGAQSELQSLSGQFAIWRYGEAEWLIVTPGHIQVSPTGESLVWTAFRSSDFADAALFILSLVDGDLQQFDMPYPMYPQWSPDGSKILLSFPQNIPDEYPLQYPGNHVFDVTTSTLIKVSDSWGTPQWLEDSSGFLAFGGGTGPLLDIRVGASNQESANILMILEDLLPFEPNPSLCAFEWSELQQKVYLITGCFYDETETESNTPQQLYSVDLNGNIAFEASISDLYLANAYRPEIFILVADDNVIIIVRTIVDPTPDDITIAGDKTFEFMVGKLNANNDLEVIYSESVPLRAEIATEVKSLEISPDGNFISLGLTAPPGSGVARLVVIDAISGSKQVDYPANGVVCNLNWLDNSTLVFAVIDAPVCRIAFPTPPTQIASVDASTGIVTTLGSEFNAPTWLIGR